MSDSGTQFSAGQARGYGKMAALRTQQPSTGRRLVSTRSWRVPSAPKQHQPHGFPQLVSMCRPANYQAFTEYYSYCPRTQFLQSCTHSSGTYVYRCTSSSSSGTRSLTSPSPPPWTRFAPGPPQASATPPASRPPPELKRPPVLRPSRRLPLPPRGPQTGVAVER